jgi:membrane-bound lytic murein transglycosylase B
MVLLLLTGCATPQRAAPPQVAPAAPAAPAAPVPPQVGGDAKFQAFVRDFEAEALAAGIRPETYGRAMAGIAPVQSVIDANLNQPEFARPIWLYLDSAVSARRVADGQYMLSLNRPALNAIESATGVPKEILVAIWGMESDYGRDMGGYNLFAALATLAYDGPRQAYAKPELLAALKMLQEQNYSVTDMVASWAGAFGQSQFTPSNFFKYGRDGDGDGRIDLWHSAPDALASAAELLKQSGWVPGQGWGYPVSLPAGFAYEDADLDVEKPLSDWSAGGVTLISGAPLPAGEWMASIYLPAGARGPAFLVTANFKTILKYNNAASYALAVALLADRIAGGAPLPDRWPRDERALARSERLRLQSELTALGFDAGTPDGVIGRKSRAAIRLYQKARGLAADGFASAALLARLDGESPPPAAPPA